MRSSPGLASISRPSTVTVTVVFFGASAGVSDTRDLRAGVIQHGAAVLDVVLELAAEELQRRRQRCGRRRTQHADRCLTRRPGEAGADVVGYVQEQVQIAGPAVAVDDPFQDALEPRRAFAARGAF